MAEQEQDTNQETKTHVWWYRAERTSQPVQHEFGMALTKRQASDQIARQHGLKELPSSAVVSTRQLEQLEPLGDDDAQDDAQDQGQDVSRETLSPASASKGKQEGKQAK